MDRLQISDLEKLLGIFEPWQIADFQLDMSAESLTVQLTEKTVKSKFPFLGKPTLSKQDDKKIHRWQHINFGQFTTYIETPSETLLLLANKSSLPPTFLGTADKSYTLKLEQTVSYAHARNLDIDSISALCNIDKQTVQMIVRNLNAESKSDKEGSILPLENAAIWRDILLDKTTIPTKLLPLKLLLSRLKLNVYNNPSDRLVLQRSISELRTFFIHHAKQLKAEYQQIGAVAGQGLSADKAKKGKLILPAAKNPLWKEILSGEIDLHSRDMPLNMFMTQMKKKYIVARSDEHKLMIITEVQTFFKKNARTLIPELTILTKLVQGRKQESNNVELPDLSHKIWEKILSDDSVLPSDQLNYRLLLARLRAAYLRSEDQDSIAKTVAQLREFFHQNQKAMGTEIKRIQSLAVAI